MDTSFKKCQIERDWPGKSSEDMHTMPVSVMSCCTLVKLGLLKGMKSKYVSEATTE